MRVSYRLRKVRDRSESGGLKDLNLDLTFKMDFSFIFCVENIELPVVFQLCLSKLGNTDGVKK